MSLTATAIAGSVRSPFHGAIIKPILHRPGSRPNSERKLRAGADVTYGSPAASRLCTASSNAALSRTLRLTPSWTPNGGSVTALVSPRLDTHRIEARYHWPRTDIAVQWQGNHGSARSVYGGQAQSEIVQGIVTFFF